MRSVVVALIAVTSCGGRVDGASSSGSTTSATPTPTTDTCGAVPSCDRGQQSGRDASICTGKATCERRRACGSIVWCTDGAAQCENCPICPWGSEPVETCPRDARCDLVDWCDAKTLCMQTQALPPPLPPSCDPGHVQVAGPLACSGSDRACYKRSVCGGVVWCSG